MSNFLEQIKQAGVLGAGGAGFPTHIKLNAQVEYVIVNGAECEPLLRANQQMLAKYAEEIYQSLQLVMQHTKAAWGIIALKKKYQPAVTALEGRISRHEKCRMHLLEDFYPAGDEHVLVHEVTGRVVPEGGIPLAVGCVVINVETLLNVLWATQGLSVTHKFVTMAGAVRNPFTARVPIGTKIGMLIELAGGAYIDNYSLIEGGPMMGKLVSEESAVSKTTGGVILLPDHHPLVQQKAQNVRISILRAKATCCQCRICTELCPRYLLGHELEPHRIMRAISSENVRDCLTNAFLCTECGACESFACPMGLSPRQVNGMLKQELGKAGIKNEHRRSELQPREKRDWHKIPGKRLIARLGLGEYDLPAPLLDVELKHRGVGEG